MEKCVKVLVEGDSVKQFIEEISCNPTVVSLFGVMSWWKWAILIIALIIFLVATFVQTKQETVKIVERFGKFKKIMTAGISLRVPFIDTVAGEMSLRIREVGEQISVKSKDNAFILIPVKVQFRVITEKAYEAFYRLENAEGQIVSYIVNIIRSQASTLTMDEIFVSKDTFELAVKQEFTERFAAFGYEVENVLVDDPQPSNELKQAFDRVIQSGGGGGGGGAGGDGGQTQRQKEAAENIAEAKRIELVGGAKAEAESLQLKADAYVKQREIMAKGLKAGTGMDDEKVLEFLERVDWRDTIRDASQNPASTIVIPMDMTGDLSKFITANKV